MHVALLGDSILDNHAYTKGAPDVAGHLRQLLPGSAQATLCAVDGSTTSDLNLQIARVPSDASHIVISIGGNDALLNSDLLSTPVASTTEALSLFAKQVTTDGGECLEFFERAWPSDLHPMIGPVFFVKGDVVPTVFQDVAQSS